MQNNGRAAKEIRHMGVASCIAIQFVNLWIPELCE